VAAEPDGIKVPARHDDKNRRLWRPRHAAGAGCRWASGCAVQEHRPGVCRSATPRRQSAERGFSSTGGAFKLASKIGGVAMRVLALVVGVVCWCALSSTGAQAQIYHGNDTGGIIPWSCENEAAAPQIAAEYCARWDKYPRITSVHRQYGDFIAFNCLWSPHIAKYALPAVRTRGCPYERGPAIIVK
jgi:hypothetical protein